MTLATDPARGALRPGPSTAGRDPWTVAILLGLIVPAAWMSLLAAAWDGPGDAATLLAALCRPALPGRGSGLADWAWTFAGSLGMALLMTTAMMLPTAAPRILAYGDAAPTTGGRPVRPLAVMAGYTAVWAVVAIVGAAVQFGAAAALGSLALPDKAVAILAGAAVGAAGFYQFSETKAVCLARCRVREPLAADGRWPGLRSGVAEGLACLGCCGPVMAMMLAIGAMNLVWMALFTALMTVEKLVPSPWLTRAIGAALVLAGAALAVSAVGLSTLLRVWWG